MAPNTQAQAQAQAHHQAKIWGLQEERETAILLWKNLLLCPFIS